MKADKPWERSVQGKPKILCSHYRDIFQIPGTNKTLKGNFIISLDHLLLGDVVYVRPVNLIVMCLLLHPC